MSSSATGTTAVGALLGCFVADMATTEIPEEALEKLRCSLLHDIACALAAHAEGAPLWALVRRRAGAAEATLLGIGERVSAEHAAFANGALMHTRAQDDTHFSAKTHVGSAILPAALALAERESADGEAFARAALAGFEVAAAVGERLAAVSTARGFRASPVYGTLGAAAAAASLLNLDAERSADAIAIAASLSCGLNQTWIDGTGEYRLHLGHAARNGIVAADLAREGFRGAPRWYEGDAGFVRAFAGEGADPGSPWELGERWRIVDVTYKPYPVCAITQSPVQIAINIASEHDLRAEDVSAVRCYLNGADRSYPGTVNPGPYGDIAATLMSAEFCVAMALDRRTATLAGLRDADDERLAHLVSVTEVLADDRLPSLAARVEVDARGTTFSGELIPDASTYGWDWQGVRDNVARMEPEMAVDRAALDALARAVREVLTLESVEPLVRAPSP